jgi:peptide/nickel transport system substrate-binding protein
MDQAEVLEVLMRKFRTGGISRRQFVQAATLFGLGSSASIFFAGCVAETTPSPSPTAAGVPPSPAGPVGSVRFLVAETFWADWHPYQTSAQIAIRIGQQLFDHLVEVETADVSRFSPGLAKTWKQLDDLTWEFVLQEGVKFHDGKEFTAEDVKASIELASGATPVKTVLAQSWTPTTVEIVDQRTVRLKTKTPFAPLLGQLARLAYILSATDIAAGEDKIKKAPNGTGAFRLVKDEKDRKTMEAFTSYWRGAPRIKELVWEFIQDPQTRLSALLAGQAHAIDRVPPEHLQIIGGSPTLALTSTTGIENVNLWIKPGRGAPFENQKFREAVAWSVDREVLVRNLVQGASKVATSFLPELTRFHAPQTPTYTFDPDKAKAALAAAGYPDGGPEFEMWGATGFLPRGKEVVEAMADGMRKVGLKPKIVLTDVAGVVNDIFSTTGTGRLYHLSWSSDGDPDTALHFLLRSPGPWGDGDPKVDELIDKGVASTKDEERAKIYAELQTYLWRKVPHVPLYNSDFTIAHAKKLQGLRVLPTFATHFYPASLSP